LCDFRERHVEAVEPLVVCRTEEGLYPVTSTEPIERAIASALWPPSFLLLVGDDEAGKEAEPWYLAAQRRPPYRWRREQAELFASDAVWGYLDNDGIPDIPVGRISARTRDEADVIVVKILAFERGDATVDDLRLPVWAGAAGYGEVIDRVASGILMDASRRMRPTGSSLG
jgi:hypothetical protein